jgi:tetratricopeptide (TPR) repeat protein
MTGMDDLSQALVQAVALHRKGDFAQAERLYLRVLAARSDHFDALQMLGLLRYQQKRLPEALSLLDAAVQAKPDFPPLHVNRGLVLDALGRGAEALASYDRGLALAPTYAEALHHRGLVLRSLARPAEALASFDQALAIRPGHAEDHYNRGNVLRDLERPAEALASFDHVLVIKPDHVGALNNRGLALLGLQRPADALASFERALAIRPDHVRALNNRGNTLQALRRPGEALAAYDKALAVQPDHAEALYNRGIVLRDLKRPAEALASFDRALSADPDHVDALNNRGIVLRDLDRPFEALASYDRALSIDPGYAEAHSNRSCLELLLGDFERGWEEFEWRWRVPDFAPWRRDFAQPLWRGDTPLEGRTILLHAEQGFGDTIQFVRYVPLVAAGGAVVILEVPLPLKALLSELAGAARVVGRGEELPAFDCHCPLLSLPLAFNTRLETIPAPVPYLTATRDRVEKWRQRLPGTRLRRVGIAWAGNANFKGDQSRSIGLPRLSPLLSVPGCQLVGLQKDLRDGDRDILRSHPQLIHSGDAIEDFADTAAVMSLMDLVVSSDTSVAHLAGALGKPVWILLPYVADWRWLRGRADNPWYPTARLFRQPELDDWESVIGRVKDELAGA